MSFFLFSERSRDRPLPSPQASVLLRRREEDLSDLLLRRLRRQRQQLRLAQGVLGRLPR